MGTTQDQQNRAEEEAAQWVIRLGGGSLSAQEQRDLDAWRAASVSHEAAFLRASVLWSDLDLGGREKKARYRRVAMQVATAGLAGLCVLGGGVGTGWVEPARWFADYTTSKGEIRTVRLEDGSSAVLDSHAAINIRYTAQERRVVLLGGQAYFTVAPVAGGEHRPFVVQAANGGATALGTQFMVTREGRGVDTTVTEHSVRVTAWPHGTDPQSVIVPQGQSIHYDQDGIGHPHQVAAATVTAWRMGQLVFDNAPLSAVIEQLNRYRRGRIVLVRRGLATRRVSGVFACADVGSATATITRELGVKTLSVGGLITLMY